VTVNSGGVVFIALFRTSEIDEVPSKEAAAVIKIAPSRMATQSERFGYELAKWLGVRTPQVSSPYAMAGIQATYVNIGLSTLLTNAGQSHS
jgi:hypothetical protein